MSIYAQSLVYNYGSLLQKADSIYISVQSPVFVTKYSNFQYSFTKNQLLYEMIIILYSLLQIFGKLY